MSQGRESSGGKYAVGEFKGDDRQIGEPQICVGGGAPGGGPGHWTSGGGTAGGGGTAIGG